MNAILVAELWPNWVVSHLFGWGFVVGSGVIESASAVDCHILWTTVWQVTPVILVWHSSVWTTQFSLNLQCVSASILKSMCNDACITCESNVGMISVRVLQLLSYCGGSVCPLFVVDVNSSIYFTRRILRQNLKFSSRKIFTCLPSG